MKIPFVAERLDNKLVYILKQFLDFSLLDIQIEASKPKGAEAGVEKKIYYLASPEKVNHAQGIFIYSSPDWGKAGDKRIGYRFLEKDFFVWEGFSRQDPLIRRDGQRVYLNFDLFAQAFYQLSCCREYFLEAEGRRAFSNAQKIPDEKNIFDSPNVNSLFLLLEGLIADIFGVDYPARGRYPSGKQFAVLLTHDLDAVKKTAKGRAKHVFHGLNRSVKLAASGKLNRLPVEISRTFSKFIRPACYGNLTYLAGLEEKNGVRSGLNIYAMDKQNKAGFKKWFYNPDYDISGEKQLANEIKKLTEKHFEPGIHGSFSSSCDSAQFCGELKILGDCLGSKISGGRQHFLDYSVSRSPQVFQDAGLDYDTSVGFRDMNGFRAGACLPYHLYSLSSDSQTQVLEFPLAVMDGVLFDHGDGTRESAWNETAAILEKIKGAQGCCSVVWHAHVFANPDYPYWEEIYLKLISWVKDNDGELLTPGELSRFWRRKDQDRLIYA